jgi:hypothetical protein
LLVKEPDVAFSVVFESRVVGFCEVLQQTPLAVIAEPPFHTIVPPEVAELPVISEIEDVVITGTAS